MMMMIQLKLIYLLCISETKENGVNSHHKVDIPEETKTEIKIPEKTPTVPSGLPPIESNCKIATGEALRG